jgi:hypothetical protein
VQSYPDLHDGASLLHSVNAYLEKLAST